MYKLYASHDHLLALKHALFDHLVARKLSSAAKRGSVSRDWLSLGARRVRPRRGEHHDLVGLQVAG
jgi:hypothetical protein